jgi:hypothetical protein
MLGYVTELTQHVENYPLLLRNIPEDPRVRELLIIARHTQNSSKGAMPRNKQEVKKN